MSIEEIASEIKACRRCDLHLTRSNPVPGEGPQDAKVVFVGEAPGREEDRSGRPFVGRAGRLLNKALKEAGLKREDVFITNVVKCRPPGNRNPRREEILACLPYLKRQINAIDPDIICLLGRVALQVMLNETTVSKLHGQVIRRGRAFMPMYHPAAALRNPRLRTVVAEDMKRLGEFLAALYIRKD